MTGRHGVRLVLELCLALLLACGREGKAQGPTIETTPGIVPGLTGTPGSMQSPLGSLPGSGSGQLGIQPGRDESLLGRIGTAAPRVPASIRRPARGCRCRRGGGSRHPSRCRCTAGAALRHPGTPRGRRAGGACRRPDARPGDRSSDPGKPGSLRPSRWRFPRPARTS